MVDQANISSEGASCICYQGDVYSTDCPLLLRKFKKQKTTICQNLGDITIAALWLISLFHSCCQIMHSSQSSPNEVFKRWTRMCPSIYESSPLPSIAFRQQLRPFGGSWPLHDRPPPSCPAFPGCLSIPTASEPPLLLGASAGGYICHSGLRL